MTSWPPAGSRARDGGLDRIDVPGGGALWLCGKHVVGPDPKAALTRAGATLLVSLCERHELDDRYPDYVTWLGRGGDGAALWSPIPDLGVPSVTTVDGLVADIGRRLADGVVVHCGAGHGRAATIALCVLAACGVPPGDGLGLIQAARPLAGPQTRDQQAFVDRYAAHGLDMLGRARHDYPVDER